MAERAAAILWSFVRTYTPAEYSAGARKVSACAYRDIVVRVSHLTRIPSINQFLFFYFNLSSHEYNLRETVPYSFPEYRPLPDEQLQLAESNISSWRSIVNGDCK